MGHHTSEVVLKYTDQFTTGFQKSIQQLKSGTLVSKKLIRDLNYTGTSMLKVGTMMFVPLAAGIKKCLDEEMNYENALAKVKTIADESQKSIGTIGEEMKNVSKKYGQDITSVADTFYQVISATVDTANAIDYVEVASKMAVGGFADMQTAVGGLTASMAAYKDKGYDMYRIGDILAQTQVKGKTTINELSESLGEVLPYASNVGMSFEDLGTSMAVLTSNGLSTSMATVTLKNAINSILNPSANAKKAFEKLGVAYGSNAFKGGSFGDYLAQLKEAIGLSDTAKEKLTELMKNEDVTDEELTEFYKNAGVNIDNLLTLFKNIRGATAMLSLTGSVEKYKTFRESMNEENSSGLLEKQADIMMDTPKMQMQILTQNLNDNLRKFGEKLMPKFNQFLGYANDMLEKLNGMSDEQISKIVDNVVTIAGWGAGLMIVGTIAKSLASILTLVNIIWKPLSKLIFAKAATMTAAEAAAAATAETAATAGASVASGASTLASGMAESATAVAPATTTVLVDGVAQTAEIVESGASGAETALATVGDTGLATAETFTSTSYLPLEAGMKVGAGIAQGVLTFVVSEGIKKITDFALEHGWQSPLKDANEYVPEEVTKVETHRANISNATRETNDNSITNNSNVYISNVDVSGVSDLNSIIDELNEAADSMR